MAKTKAIYLILRDGKPFVAFKRKRTIAQLVYNKTFGTSSASDIREAFEKNYFEWKRVKMK